MRSLSREKNAGAILPTVMVTLAIVSGLLGVVWQRVSEQAQLAPTASLDDQSRGAVPAVLLDAQQSMTTDPLSIEPARSGVLGPMAPVSSLAQSGLRVEPGTAALFTQWSASGPACPQRVVGSADASGAQACSERIGFTVWAGEVGGWPRHVVQSEWELVWPAAPTAESPIVRGPAVRQIR